MNRAIQPDWLLDQENKLVKHPGVLSLASFQHFVSQGFLVIPGMFHAEELQALRESADSLIQMAHERGPLDPEFDAVHPHEFKPIYEGAQFVLKPSSGQKPDVSIQRIVGIGEAAPLLRDATRHPHLLQVMSGLLGSDQMEQLICQLHVKEPGDGVAFFPHRDAEFRLAFDPAWRDLNQFGSYVVACIALEDADRSNGCLWGLPGSHLGVQIDQGLVPARDTWSPELTQDAIPFEAKAGDVLLMHAYLVHWSGANEGGSRSRRTLLGGFAVPGANHAIYPGSGVNEVISSPNTLEI